MNKKKSTQTHSYRVAYLLFFSALLLLLMLGGWQLSRGFEKVAIETRVSNKQESLLTIDRAPSGWDDLMYRQVRLQGIWRAEHTFLMANRIYRGSVGYEVFSPFQLEDQSTLLINRGWIADHDTLVGDALASESQTPVEIFGQLYPPKKGFTLGAAIHSSNTVKWPMTAQYFDLAALSSALGVTLQPVALVLPPNHPETYQRIWQAYTMNSTRHFGYAAQWWGLAATLIVFGIIWRRQSTHALA